MKGSQTYSNLSLSTERIFFGADGQVFIRVLTNKLSPKYLVKNKNVGPVINKTVYDEKMESEIGCDNDETNVPIDECGLLEGIDQRHSNEYQVGLQKDTQSLGGILFQMLFGNPAFNISFKHKSPLQVLFEEN
jgi:hypothetical protein